MRTDFSSGLPKGRAARGRRVLISTLAPAAGGVSAMADFVASTLAAHGEQPVLAHYLPYPDAPELSVPSFSLLRRNVGSRPCAVACEFERHDIGAWLPELEYTHYLANRHWRRLMDSCDAFVAVSGNVLAATPFWQTHRPYLAWVATDWAGDRVDRVRRFPAARRVFDRLFVRPVARKLERELLAHGKTLPISRHSAATLAAVAGQGTQRDILHVPVDSARLQPQPSAIVPWRLGFLGRFLDPRKNIGLLLESVALLRRRGAPVSAVLAGAEPDEALLGTIAKLGLENAVEFAGRVPKQEIGSLLCTLDLFVVPSHQEGLCIAALEAMSCGVPVVSTRCGGPEEFVIEGKTGRLCDATPENMAAAVCAILGDRSIRAQLGAAARQLVCERYTTDVAEALFMREFHLLFDGQATPSHST